MAFVERKNGKIVSVYRSKQPGHAEEVLNDNDPEILAFESTPIPSPLTARSLADALIAKGVIVESDLQ